MALAALVCAFLWPVLFGGKALLPADMLLRMEPWRHYGAPFPQYHRPQNPMLDPIQQYYPWRMYAARSIRAGEVPLWNPYMFCGAPFVGNGQSAAFHPVNALFYLMWPPRAFGYAAALNLLLAGVFTFLLLRSLEMRRWPALLGAVTFSYCGFVVVWLEFPTFLSTGLWLPAALFFFQRASLTTIARRHGAASMWSAACGCSIACMLSGGHLQVAFYALLAFAGFALCRIIQLCRKTWRGTARLARCCVLALGIGMALSALHLLPVLETGRASSRAVAPRYGGALELRLRWPNAVTFLVPDLFRTGIFYDTWDGHPLNYIETCGYVGVAPLLLVPLGLAWRRRGDAFLFAALLLLALLLAFGSPLNYVFFRLAPGYAIFRGIGRAVYLSSFGLAVLAARGASRIGDGLLSKVHRRTNILGAVCVAALIVVISVVLTQLGRGGYHWAGLAREFGGVDLVGYQWSKIGLFAGFGFASALAIVLLGHWRPRLATPLLVALIVADLFIFGYRFNPKVDLDVLRVEPRSRAMFAPVPGSFRVVPHPPQDNPLRTMPSNLPMLWGLQDVGGSDTVVWTAYHRLRKALSDASEEQPHGVLESPVLDLLNVRYALTGAPLYPPPEGWELAAAPDMLIYENREAMPRAFVTYAPPRTLPPHECLRAMLQPDWQPSEPLLVAQQEDAASSPLRSSSIRTEAGERFTTADIVTYEPNRVVIGAHAEGDGLLVLADAYNPGWRAFVDGTERPIVRTDYILRGVPLTAGAHDVEFVYLPASFKVGAFVSCLALCFLAGLSTCHILRVVVPARRRVTSLCDARLDEQPVAHIVGVRRPCPRICVVL